MIGKKSSENNAERRQRRPIFVVFLGLSGVLALLVVLAAGLAYRLSQGPISIAHLAPYLLQQSRVAETGLNATLRDLVVTTSGWSHPVEVKALDLAITSADGDHIIDAPEVRLGLNPISLLIGRLSPTTLTANGVNVRVVRGPDGAFQVAVRDLGIGPPAADQAAVDPGRLRQFWLENLPSLTSINLLDTNVNLNDRRNKTVVQIAGADLELVRREDGVQISVAGAVSGHVEDPDVGFAGRAAVTAGPIAASGPVPINADLTGIAVTAPMLFADPPDALNLALQLEVQPGFDELLLKSAELSHGTVTVTARGRIGGPPIGRTLEIAGELHDLNTDDLARLWPRTLKPTARNWVARNITGGRVRSGRFAVAIGEDAQDPVDLSVEFDFENVTAAYLAELPKITAADGTGRLTAGALEIEVASATVGVLTLAGGRFAITDFRRKPVPAEADVTVQGPIAAQLELIGEPPIDLTAELPFDPATIAGVAETELSLQFPLRSGLTPADVGFSVQSRLTDLTVPNFAGRVSVKQGEFDLRASRKGLALKGRASLNKAVLNIDYARPFANMSRNLHSVRLTGTVGASTLTRFGIDLSSIVEGRAAMDLRVTERRDHSLVGDLDLDLTKTGIDIGYPVFFSKLSGAPGKVSLKIDRNATGAVTLQDIRANGDNFVVAGDIGFDAGFKLNKVALGELAWAGNRARVDWRPDVDRGLVKVDAKRIDLRPFINDMKSRKDNLAPDTNSGLPEHLRLDLTAERVDLANGIWLKDVKAEAARVAGLLRHIRATAHLNNGAPATLDFADSNENRLLVVRAGDAGELLRGIGVYDNIRGGNFYLQLLFLDPQPGRQIDGRIKISEFELLEAPILARILTVGSLTGISDLLEGDGITFGSARIPFRIRDDVIHIEEAKAKGPALGLTANGEANIATRQTDLSGSIIPAYTLNNLIGYVPLLGRILAPDGEGVFGATYSLRGDWTGPEASVNPLAALAPGILRRLFLAKPGEIEQVEAPVIDGP